MSKHLMLAGRSGCLILGTPKRANCCHNQRAKPPNSTRLESKDVFGYVN